MTSSPADLERVQDEDERVRAVPDADRLADAEIARGLLLEGGDVRAEHELTTLEHAVDRFLEQRDQGRVLRLDVDERDLARSRGRV